MIKRSEQFPPGSNAPGAQAWTPRRALARAVQVVRNEGLRALWFKAVGETVYRRLVLFETVLDEPPEPAASSRPLEFRFLSEADVDEYARLRPDRAPVEAAARLHRGDRCYGAWYGPRIVAARWITEGETEIEYLARRVVFAERTVYRYDAYTSPDYRGRGIIGAVGTRLIREIWAEGTRRVIGTSLPENLPSRRMLEKEGLRPLAKIGYVKLGRRRWNFGPDTI
jgi:RimJ/RimL family protein N-acetyltransferase